MKALLIPVIVAVLAAPIAAQPALDSATAHGLTTLSTYLGLTLDDISFRNDYTEPDSFRLAKIAELMNQPLGLPGYSAQLAEAHVPGQPEILASILFADLKDEDQRQRLNPYRPSGNEMNRAYDLYFTNEHVNQLLLRASNYIDIIIPRSTDMMLARLSAEERAYLTRQFKEVVVTREEEEFLSVEAIDSLEKVEEEYVEYFTQFGHLIDEDPLIQAGIDCLRDILLEVRNIRSRLAAGEIDLEELFEQTAFTSETIDPSTLLGRQPGWKVGGTGDDYYGGEYKFILDFGGNDIYDLSYNPDNPHPVIIIDLGGDDRYRGESDFAVGSGCLSVGILLDFAGNDRYDARSFALGSGWFGFGLLYDADGDDRYDGDTHVQAAGTFGLGMLIDEGGRDIYNAALFSQGFGFVEGMGMIYEGAGSDSYYAGGKYKDILRYEDHYLSLSQGFGYGLRPYMSGGIGIIIDISGNDSYYADIFAQAASYWWSLGMIYDSSGNDNYQCFQYGQGCGTHMTLGFLQDDFGNDVYFGKGLMQGVGHDYSVGWILDRYGDDTYTAYDLSQGAGSANGVGILIDDRGDDRYFIKKADNSQGYGNPRRDFGSIGLFIDGSGTDQYTGNGRNDYFWKTDSKWGGGMDLDAVDKTAEVSP